VVLLSGAVLAAQAPPAGEPLLYLPLDSATTVRLGLVGGGRIVGRLVAPYGPDSSRFVYCPGMYRPCRGADAGRVRAVPAAEVALVETRRGSRATRGAVAGALVAAGGAAVFCALTDTGGCDPAKGGYFSYVLLPAALAGAGIGALIGGTIPVWARAP